MPVAAAADGPSAYQVDPAHSGNAPGTAFAPPLGKKWVRRDLGEGVSFPVLAEGRVFLTAGSAVYALDRATGATVWTRPMRASGVAYDNGRVFAVDSTGVMQALSAASGNVLWSTRLPGASSSIGPPIAYGEHVYASSNSTAFGARQDLGVLVWSSPVSTSDRSIPAGDGDRVYVDRGCGAIALERRSGTEVWDRSGDCSGSRFAGRAPAVQSGQVFSGGVVVDALTGLLRDTYAASLSPAFAGGTGYFADGKQVYARDSGSGVAVWRYTDEEEMITPPLVAGEFVNAPREIDGTPIPAGRPIVTALTFSARI